MDIALLSGMYPYDMEKKYIESSEKMPQLAGHNFQEKLVKGIEHHIDKPIKLINMVPLGDYPFASKIFYVRGSEWQHCKGAKDVNIPYVNLYGVRQFSRKRAILNELLNWAENNTCEKKIVISCAVLTPFLYAMYHVKKTNPQISTCLIVPDLPQYMNMSPSIVYQFLKSIDIKEQEKYYDAVDSFVFFSKHMLDYFGRYEKKHIVVEAIVDCYEESVELPVINEDTKIILYSGAVEKEYGIENLLQAFSYLNDEEIELHICGDGNAVSEVKSAAQKDKRIKYLGVVYPREKVISMQKRASLLVNPRPNHMIFTKYSFPSKTIEYLQAGVPVLMFKLDGIPDEYDSYLHYFDSDNPVEMAKNIKQLLDMDYSVRKDIGKRGREFVQRTKNNIIQAQRIINLIIS